MNVAEHAKPVVLTIAGFDPSGGAGIIADVRTIESFGCTAVAAITSVTIQNSEKYWGAIHQTAESVRAQVEAILDASSIAAVKVGMLPTAELVCEVVRLVRDNSLPAPVIDPAMESTTGGKLMADDAFEAFVTGLMPLARLVTPNISEAEKLAGLNIQTEEEMRQAAARIRELGAPAVLIKGGHLQPQRPEVRDQRSENLSQTSDIRRQMSEKPEREAIDLLDDGGQLTIFRSDWVDAPNVRGTGCMLSSAIAAFLARGADLGECVAAAKEFVGNRISDFSSGNWKLET